jgi:chromate transporter
LSEGREGGSVAEILLAFLKLGLTSFGGPVAHLGYFRTEFVERRRWLGEADFADLVALCQFLPGPASSQVGMALGLRRSGLLGALAAWIGFTAPSALLMILFAYGVTRFADLAASPWLHGLRLVAVAVVAQAVWSMARSLCPDRLRVTIAVLGALIALTVPSSLGQIAAITLGGCAGWWLVPKGEARAGDSDRALIPRGLSISALILFAALLVGLPLLSAAYPDEALILVDRFYRAGALVFGGGHVVLPLLQSAVVPPGWIGDDAFMAGYGAAQAVPGPLFTFAAYLGAAMGPTPNGWAGGLICLTAIFLPSFLLIVGALPFWHGLLARPGVQTAVAGINASVVGLLLAALYSPAWTGTVKNAADFSVVALAFLLLAAWKLPPWLVVGLGAAVAGVLGLG